MKSNLLITMFLAIFFFYGCKKGENANEVVPPLTNGLGAGEVGISGSIKNPDGSAAEGVEVIIDGNRIVTPASGLFEYIGKVRNVDKVKLAISKKGYFKYSKILTLEENSTIENLTYYLSQERNTGSFESATGGTITTSYATLVFQPNSFVKEDGSGFNGKVSVKMPSDIISDYEDKLPGDARALTSSNEKVVVERWGGMNVQVYDDNGQRLKLIKPVNYTYKIDWRYIYIDRSKKIKIWTYNDVDDIWTEAGDAGFTGQNFTGSTSNLSYLQWGIAYPQALLRAFVKDAKSNAASFFKIGCGLNQFNGKGLSGVRINSKGIALLYTAANVNTYTYITSPCNETLGAFVVSPIATDKKADETFTVNLAPYITTFEGKIEDCNFSGIKGKAEYTVEGKKVVSILNNGSFNYTFLRCKDSFIAGELIIYDEQNNIVHQNSNYSVKGGEKNNYYATTCTKTQTGKITINLQGKAYTYESPKDQISLYETYDTYGNLLSLISAQTADKKESFLMTMVSPSFGQPRLYYLSFTIPTKNYGMSLFTFEPVTVLVTKHKTGNIVAEGTFKTKTYLNYSPYGSNEEAELSGSFSISR